MKKHYRSANVNKRVNRIYKNRSKCLFFFFFVLQFCFFFSSLVFFALTLYWSYKFDSFKEVLYSVCRVALVPVSMIILWFCVMMSVLFTDKYPPDRFWLEIMLIMCFVGNLIPFGIVAAKGIKEKNKAQCRVGTWGLATIVSLLTALMCFAYFSCACT